MRSLKTLVSFNYLSIETSGLQWLAIPKFIFLQLHAFSVKIRGIMHLHPCTQIKSFDVFHIADSKSVNLGDKLLALHL